MAKYITNVSVTDDMIVDIITTCDAKSGWFLNSTLINAVLTAVGNPEEITRTCAMTPLMPKSKTSSSAIIGPHIRRENTER